MWNSFFILYRFSLISIFIYALSCLNVCIYVLVVVVLFERGFVCVPQQCNVFSSMNLQDVKELLDNNCCPMHLKSCVVRKEDNYYFALSKYKKFLEETLTQNPNFFQPSFLLNEVRQQVIMKKLSLACPKQLSLSFTVKRFSQGLRLVVSC